MSTNFEPEIDLSNPVFRERLFRAYRRVTLEAQRIVAERRRVNAILNEHMQANSKSRPSVVQNKAQKKTQEALPTYCQLRLF
jgi:hypothetical protein